MAITNRNLPRTQLAELRWSVPEIPDDEHEYEPRLMREDENDEDEDD
jgi:hypothetical protein